MAASHVTDTRRRKEKRSGNEQTYPVDNHAHVLVDIIAILDAYAVTDDAIEELVTSLINSGETAELGSV